MTSNNLNVDNMLQLENYHERIDFTHRYAQLLKFNLMKLSHKSSKVRDSGDELAQGILEFSSRDVHSNSMNEKSALFNFNLKEFAYCLLAIEDHRDSNIECVNSMVLSNMNRFIESVKYTKENDLRTLRRTYKNDQPRKKNLINEMLNKSNIKNLKNHEDDIEDSAKNSLILNKKISDEIENFESRRIEEVQDILTKYTLSQINFHNKALDIYTNAYKSLINKDFSYNVKNDLNHLSKSLYTTSHLDMDLERLIQELNDKHDRKPSILRRNQKLPPLPQQVPPSHRNRSRDCLNSSTSSLINNSLSYRDSASADRYVPNKLKCQKSKSAVGRLTNKAKSRERVNRDFSKDHYDAIDIIEDDNIDRSRSSTNRKPVSFNETTI